MSLTSIVFCGRDGCDAAKLADYRVLACGAVTSTIQEQYIVLAHTLCECVETAMFG